MLGLDWIWGSLTEVVCYHVSVPCVIRVLYLDYTRVFSIQGQLRCIVNGIYVFQFACKSIHVITWGNIRMKRRKGLSSFLASYSTPSLWTLITKDTAIRKQRDKLNKGSTINDLGAEKKSKMNLFFPRECLLKFLKFIFSWRSYRPGTRHWSTWFPPAPPPDNKWSSPK